MEPIGYISDPVPVYSKAITAAKNIGELRHVVEDHRLIAADALEAVDASEFDWEEWQKGLRTERLGRFSGEKWMDKYGAIALPAMMLRVGMIAQRFGAPWGCAYIRCKDFGSIVEEGDPPVAVWHEKQEAK